MNVYRIPFNIKHILFMELREHEKQCMDANEEYLDNVMAMARIGDAITLVTDDDDIMACFGAFPYWNGMFEIWAVTGKPCDKYPIAFHRAALDYLRDIEIKFHPHRIQANIDAGYDRNTRWIQRLGFKYEGIMEAFSSDKRDYIRYAKVNGRH